jgi:hypothetical protein
MHFKTLEEIDNSALIERFFGITKYFVLIYMSTNCLVFWVGLRRTNFSWSRSGPSRFLDFVPGSQDQNWSRTSLVLNKECIIIQADIHFRDGQVSKLSPQFKSSHTKIDRLRSQMDQWKVKKTSNVSESFFYFKIHLFCGNNCCSWLYFPVIFSN